MPHAPRNDVKSQSHLINILKATRDHHPNFALFLGAGASVTSGVKTTQAMIRDWRVTRYQTSGSSDAFEDYLKSQNWYESSEEYSVLFELLYDQPSQRREFIESCLKDANPSWGYIYLVNLLKNRVFNTVFTTNFDDLLNEACYLFSDSVRPIVCAHDSSIRSVRITSTRAKIVKLHGDFLFDDIKNTINELESLEGNMRDKFKQCAAEFGLIVIGYAGNDRSVMDALNACVRSDLNFPHGVYWCVRKNSLLSPAVENLRRYPKFKLVEISGFDELIAEIHDALDLSLQPEMSDPYGSLVGKLNRLLDNSKIPAGPNIHPVIRRDIERIGKKIELSAVPQISEEETAIAVQVSGTTVSLPIPFELLAQLRVREGDIDGAMKFLTLELKARPSPRVFVEGFRMSARAPTSAQNWDQKLFQLLQAAKDVVATQPGSTFDMSLPLITMKQYELAERVLDLGFELHRKSPQIPYLEDLYQLNKLQIKTHKGEDFNSNEIAVLDNILATGSIPARMGAAILLKRWEVAEEYFTAAVATRQISAYEVQTTWPIFTLFEPHIKNRAILFSAPIGPVKSVTSTVVGNPSQPSPTNAISVAPTATSAPKLTPPAGA